MSSALFYYLCLCCSWGRRVDRDKTTDHAHWACTCCENINNTVGHCRTLSDMHTWICKMSMCPSHTTLPCKECALCESNKFHARRISHSITEYFCCIPLQANSYENEWPIFTFIFLSLQILASMIGHWCPHRFQHSQYVYSTHISTNR